MPELRNFHLIHPRIGLAGVREELRRNDLAWQISTARQDRLKVQRETEAIALRTGVPETPGTDLTDAQATADALAAPYFPRTMAWLRSTAAVLEGELARAMFVRLRPHGQVYRHIDHGSYYALRRRYHLVIDSPGGSRLTCGDEVVMREGELWEFDNKKPHEAFNPTDTPRVHLIFDLRMAEGARGGRAS